MKSDTRMSFHRFAEREGCFECGSKLEASTVLICMEHHTSPKKHSKGEKNMNEKSSGSSPLIRVEEITPRATTAMV